MKYNVKRERERERERDSILLQPLQSKAGRLFFSKLTSDVAPQRDLYMFCS